MANNAYAMFKTDKDAEQNGYWEEFGSFRVKLARLGGKNTDYQKLLAEGVEEVGGDPEKIDSEKVEKIYRGVFSKSVIKGWEVKDEVGNWIPGIHMENKAGDIFVGEATPENIQKVLFDLPELYDRLYEKANDYRTFREETIKEVSKN